MSSFSPNYPLHHLTKYLSSQVIQELAAEDEEDTEMPALEGPGVQVIALEGPLFEGIVGTDGSPVLALEGPPTVSSTEGKVISLAGRKSLSDPTCNLMGMHVNQR